MGEIKYVIWIADGGIFTEERNPPIQGGDIESTIFEQIKSTYTTLKETHQKDYPEIKWPTTEMINEAIEKSEKEWDMFERWTPSLLEEAKAIYDKKEKVRVLENTQLIANIKDTVIALHGEGVINIVVGFRALDFTKQVLERERVAQYLHIIDTKTTGCRLPSRRVWDDLIVHDFPDITPKNSLFIAKESAEMVFSNEINLPFVMIRSSGGDYSRCAPLNPVKMIYNTKKCLSVIKSLFVNRKEEETYPEKDTRSGLGLR